LPATLGIETFGHFAHRHARTEKLNGGIVKKKRLTFITMLSSCGLLAFPGGLPAQEQKVTQHHYMLFDVGTSGGASSTFNNPSYQALNNRGAAVGLEDTALPDPIFPNCYYNCVIEHGFPVELEERLQKSID
jgi:hypothetical protein